MSLNKNRLRQMLEQVWPAHGNVVVGVSGGSDSLALLYMLYEGAPAARGRLHAAHIHHGLRGAAADSDQRLVVRHCAALGVPCAVYHRPVAPLARQLHRSLEDTARSVRLACLLDAARVFHATAVALGHHQDDQAETLLLNLLRGTGSQGLGGMRPSRVFPLAHAPRTLQLIRPFLAVPKAELEAYLRQRGIHWREDRSNRALVHTRNRIRHRVVPYLQREFHPQVPGLLAQSAESLARDNAYLDELTEHHAGRIGRTLKSGEVVISRSRLLRLHESLQWRILSWWWDHVPLPQKSSFHLNALLVAARQGHAGLSLPGLARATTQNDYLILSPASILPGIKTWTLNLSPGKHVQPGFSWGAEVQELSASMVRKKVHLPLQCAYVYMDTEQVGKGVCLRQGKSTDIIFPLGMQGKRKPLRKVFNDLKLLPFERKNWPVIANETEVLWVFKGPMSRRVKITRRTKKAWKIRIFETPASGHFPDKA